MNCEQVKEHLSAYLDNALSVEERLSVAAHVENCQSCQSILADFAHIDALLAHLPRVSPKATLRERIFSSQEYLELSGTYNGNGPGSAFDGISPLQSSRPRLISLPGGRQAPNGPASPPSNTTQDTLPIPKQKYAPPWRQRVFYTILAASILLTLGIGGLMSWRLWQQQEKVTYHPQAITPPAALSQQGPLPAGTRFLFLRAGSLWSCASDGSGGCMRLTAKTVTVASGWAVRPGMNGQSAGNLIAYIDTLQGFVHVIRSDGQTDTLIPQALVPTSEQTASIWQTAAGLHILNSLSWSPDGSTLAFVGRDGTQKQDALYLYQPGSTGVHQIPGLQGNVGRPVWSPDSKYLAFQVTQNGTTGIAEYSLQNHEVLNILQNVNTVPHFQDTVLSLDWTADKTNPALTWSVGTVGHVHSIWLKQIGPVTTSPPVLLRTGDFAQANYNQAQVGRWLFVMSRAGRTGDLYTVDLHALLARQTTGRATSSAQWSPDGRFITYLDTLNSNTAILHLVDTHLLTDIQVGTGVNNTPAPLWSLDRQQLAYSTGGGLFIENEQTQAHPRALGPQGHITALSWSTTNPAQVILSLSDTHAGIYILDSHKNSAQQVDPESVQGEIQWSEIP